jgi:recombination DNA repair RAD52 pathway protein
MVIKEESIKKKKSKKPKSILTKWYNKDYKNKLDEVKEKFEDFELEKLLWQPKSPTNKRKRRKLIENKKTKNIKLNKNKYNTITTLDSKLFNSIKEKESVKSLLSKDDDIIKDILYELDSNKK